MNWVTIAVYFPSYHTHYTRSDLAKGQSYSANPPLMTTPLPVTLPPPTCDPVPPYLRPVLLQAGYGGHTLPVLPVLALPQHVGRPVEAMQVL